jgi:hypothetical protein
VGDRRRLCFRHRPLLCDAALLVDEADHEISPERRLRHMKDARALLGQPLANEVFQLGKIALAHRTRECFESLHTLVSRALARWEIGSSAG